jgi:Xaa-Pro aminopeptidase
MRAPDYERRRNQVRKLLRDASAESLLVSSVFNVTYLTGFTGDDSLLLISKDKCVLISDPRYEQQIEEECPGLETFIRKPSNSTLLAAAQVAKQCHVSNLLVEGDTITLAHYESLKNVLPDVQFGTSRGMVESLREIKDAWEISRIQRAITMAERAFISVKNGLTQETSEREIANDLDRAIRMLGGKGSAFATIVGVGPRAALPHGVPQDYKLKEHPFVLIDWGAREGLYLSDLTRVLVTSRIPAKFERIYNAVLDAHLAAANTLKPGVLMSAVDAAARKVLDDCGLGKRFTHGLGHGFGLQIHEATRLAKGQDRPLAENMVLTIEPGVYIPGWGGVRIEDDYLITADGCQRLTSLPRDIESNSIQLF